LLFFAALNDSNANIAATSAADKVSGCKRIVDTGFEAHVANYEGAEESTQHSKGVKVVQQQAEACRQEGGKKA
jgi:hypothetical protein